MGTASVSKLTRDDVFNHWFHPVVEQVVMPRG